MTSEDVIHPLDDLIEERVVEIVHRVAELPDRSSPDDWPEAMLVTGEELMHICREEFAELEFKALAELGTLRSQITDLRTQIAFLEASHINRDVNDDYLLKSNDQMQEAVSKIAGGRFKQR